MIYVVTGGGGFIGSNVVAEIERRKLGAVVVIDDMGSDDKWLNLVRRRSISAIRPSEGMEDWLDQMGRAPAAFGPVTLIHMGARTSTLDNDVGALVEKNAMLTKRLFRQAARFGWRFIFASSASVYGESREQSDADGTVLRPVNPYGWSKALADLMVTSEAATSTPPVWAGLRFFNVYGPNEEHKGGDKSFVTRCFDKIRDGKGITFFRGSDEFRRDWVYVRDCAKLVVDIATSDAQIGGVFNVGTGQPESFVNVASACIGAAKKEANAVTAAFPPEMVGRYQRYTKADTTKLQAAIGPVSFMSLKEGVDHYWHNYGCREGLDRYA